MYIPHQLLRVPEKVRLWLGLSEDWNSEENDEAFATACAASGTLATAVSDEGVTNAILAENCGQTMLELLHSERVELIHRALVIILELVTGPSQHKAAKHLVEIGVVPALSIIAKMKNQMLHDLVKSTAEALSIAMKAESP